MPSENPILDGAEVLEKFGEESLKPLIDELAKTLHEGEIENRNVYTRKRLGKVLGNISVLLMSTKNSRDLVHRKLWMYDSVMKMARAGNLCVAIEDGKPVAMAGFQPKGELIDGRKFSMLGRLVTLPEYRGGRKWLQVIMKIFEVYKAKHNPAQEPLMAGTMEKGLAKIAKRFFHEVTEKNINRFGFHDDFKEGLLSGMREEGYLFFFYDGSTPPEKEKGMIY